MNFHDWMSSEGVSESSLKKYELAVRGVLSDWAFDAGLINKPLMQIKSYEEFKSIKAEIEKLPIFLQRNSVGHHMYSGALNKYSDYLRATKSQTIENDIKDLIKDERLNETEKTSLINARIGQGKYRKDLINLWGGCSVTGYEDYKMLVASHIKPWSFSTNSERLDKFNGLLLLPNLDKVILPQ